MPCALVFTPWSTSTPSAHAPAKQKNHVISGYISLCDAPFIRFYLVNLEASQLMSGHGTEESILPPEMGGILMAHSDERRIITIIRQGKFLTLV